MDNLLKNNKLYLLFGAIFVFAGVFLVLSFLDSRMPDTYVYKSEYTSSVEYISIWKNAVIGLEFDPSCYLEVRSSDPSPGFGAAWSFCDKRSWSSFDIESSTGDDEERTYILKSSYPGEKGSHYRDTLLQYPDTIVYNTSVYNRSNLLLAVLRWIVGL